MQFRWGVIPTDPDVQSNPQEWRAIQGPNFPGLFVYLFPTAFGVLICLNILWLLAGAGLLFPLQRPWNHIFTHVVLFLTIIIIHELIHAIGYPDRGLSRKTIIGFRPDLLMAYAHHYSPISRNRLLFVTILPFFILSLLPLVIFVIFGSGFLGQILSTGLLFVSLMNGVLSAGDLLGAIMVFRQIPPSAVIRFSGGKVYWKL